MIAVAATSSGLLTVQPDKTASLPAAMSADGQWHAGEQRNRRVAAAKARAVIEDAVNTGPDEEHRDFGFQPDCYEEATGRNTHCNQSPMPSLPGRGQEWTISAIIARLTP